METKKVDFSRELFSDIMDSFNESWLVGYTVCGAEDLMVIELGDEFIDTHPEFEEFTHVRVTEQYLNDWNSATFLEFSCKELTDEEYEESEQILKDDEENSDQDALTVHEAQIFDERYL